jgi:hypothetical protein
MKKAALKNALNSIYSPAVTKWELSSGKAVTVSFAGGAMTHGGTSAVSVFNDDQRAIINAFGAKEKDAAYLFFVSNVKNKFEDNGDIAGYMPLQHQEGFIYENPEPYIVAHELGHGVFNLRHTFDDAKFVAARSSTENLMDYKGGTELWKHQWGEIQDPDGVWFDFWQDEEDGAWTTDGHFYTLRLIALMMELDEATALKLGKAAEEPDSHVVNEKNMEERDTWLVGGLQQKYHALTGGYHGVELAATAYALTKTHTDDASLFYLLHRFGDCFAHFEISNDNKLLTTTVQLKDYISAIDNYIDKQFIFVPVGLKIATPYGMAEMGKNMIFNTMESGVIQTCMSKEYLTKQIVEYFIQTQHTRETSQAMPNLWGISRNTMEKNILKELPQASQNEFRMYGESDGVLGCFTEGHRADGTTPDIITEREKLYLFYVAKTIELLSIKYGKKVNNVDIENKIAAIVKFAKSIGAERIDGLLAFETAKILTKNKKEIVFAIPIKYLINNNIGNKGMLFYYYSPVFAPNFSKDAQKMKEYAEVYLQETDVYMQYDVIVSLKKEESHEYWEFKLTNK